MAGTVHISVGLPGTGDGGAFDLLLRRIRDGRDDILVFVPTRRLARFLERRLLEAGPRCLRKPRLTTLNDFALDAMRTLRPQARLLEETERVLFLADILADTSRGWQAIGGERADFPGLVQAVAETIKQLKSARLTAADYAQQTRRAAAAKARDLARAYAAYEGFLHAGGFLDAQDAFEVLAQSDLETLRQGPLRGIDILILQHFYDLTAVQTACVKNLAAAVREFHLVVDDDLARPNVFAPTARMLKALPAGVRTARPGGSPQAAQLFTSKPAKADMSGVALLEARTRADEVEAIAAEIKRLALAGDLRLSDVAVTFATIGAYAPLVREVFPRYGLEFNFACGFPLHRAPAVAAVFEMMDLVSGNYHRRDLVALLRSPYVRPRLADPDLDVAFLDLAARDAGIIDGRDEWTARLADLSGKLRREAEDIGAGRYTADDLADPAAEAKARRDRAEAVGVLEEQIGAMLGELAKLEAKGTIADFCTRLRTLLDFFQVHDCSIPPSPGDLALIEIEKDLRALSGFETLLDRIAAARASEMQTKEIALRDFADLLRATVRIQEYQVRTFDDAGVQVMDIRDTRGLTFRHLFVGGVLQRAFPPARQHNVFLADDAARALGLDERERDDAEWRYHFLRLLTAAGERVVLSWPQSEDDGPLVRSPFIDELEARVHDVPRLTPATARDGEGTQPPGYSVDGLTRWLGRRLAVPPNESATVVRDLARRRDLPLPLNSLRHNLHVEARRHQEPAGIYGGVLQAADVRAALAQRFGAGHSFSITQFERYGACPFAFFAEHALGLAEAKEPEEEISPQTRGGVIHELLRWFYTERKAQGKGRPALAERGEARAGLGAKAAELFNDLPFKDLFQEKELEVVIGAGGLIDAFLEIEIGAGLTTQPTLFEFAFGGAARLGVRDPDSRKPPLALAEDVRVVGKIDRVDRDADGRVVVYDYKTGGASFPTLAQMADGLSFQLPLYLLAVREALGLTPAAGAYYQVRNGIECGPEVAVADAEVKEAKCYPDIGRQQNRLLPDKNHPETLDEFIALVGQRAVEYVEKMRGGQFPLTPRDESEAGCRRCAFRRLCRLPEREA